MTLCASTGRPNEAGCDRQLTEYLPIAVGRADQAPTAAVTVTIE